MKTFASQYGPPGQYTLVQRAKLLRTYGTVSVLLDIVQQSVLAPYAKKNNPPESVLPEEENEKPRMSEENRRKFDELLGIRHHGGKG